LSTRWFSGPETSEKGRRISLDLRYALVAPPKFTSHADSTS
jgi:hypothetical protein